MMVWISCVSVVVVVIATFVSADVTNFTLAPYPQSTDEPFISITTPDRTIPASGGIHDANTGTWFTDGYHWTRQTPKSSSFDDIPLVLSALFPLNGDGWDAQGLLVTADLALKHVNDNSDILPGYRLFMAPADSKCSDGVAIHEFFDQLFKAPPKIAVIGPACSAAAQPIASTAHYWNLTVNIDDLLTRLKQNNITVISSEGFYENPTKQLKNLKKHDAKIIISSMYENDARKLLCEVYKLGMYGEGYVWFITGWYARNWYKVTSEDVECTVDEMTQVVESSKYIGIQEKVLADVDTMTVAGITRGKYESLLHEHLKQEKFVGYTLIPEAHFGYDTIWAAALALQKTAENIRNKGFDDGGHHRDLERFSYSDHEMRDILLKAIESVNFTGVSGPVSFRRGDRIGIANIEQLQENCGEEWKIYDSYCYLFVASQKSWDEAVNHCKEEGGFLVSILSEDENQALVQFGRDQLLGGIREWWLSLKKSQEGDLKWSGGLEMELRWSPWEQEILKLDDAYNNTGGDKSDRHALNVNVQNCYILNLVLKTWLPVNCTTTMYSFICKKRAEYEEVIVATYDVKKDKIDWIREVIWPGGVFPLDHTPVILPRKEEIYEGISFVIYIITCSAAICGLIFAIVCLIFNFKFKKQRFIKMSSPNLNSLIITGCILIYVSTCMAGWESVSVDRVIFLKLFQTRIWCFSVGFVLSFGSMFSKTWRVHRVAALKNPRRVVVTDRHLFVMVGALLLVEVTVLSAWFIISPLRVEKKHLPNKEDMDNMVILQPYIQYCTSDNEQYWLGALYSYKALLLIFGVFLAWETRKVTIPALNDSKLIGLCVYNVVLLSVIGVGVSLTTRTDPSVSFMFNSAIQIFGTTVVLVIIFIPKMLSVIQYPEGKPVTTMKSATNKNTEGLDSAEDITELRTKFEQLTVQLNELQGQRPRCEHSGCGFWCINAGCGCCDGLQLEVDHIVVVKSSQSSETIQSFA